MLSPSQHASCYSRLPKPIDPSLETRTDFLLDIAEGDLGGLNWSGWRVVGTIASKQDVLHFEAPPLLQCPDGGADLGGWHLWQACHPQSCRSLTQLQKQDLFGIPSNHVKSQVGAEGSMPGACWTACLAESVNSRFSERTGLKKYGGRQQRKMPNIDL